ncbi:hypothetical protein AU106_gp206 [Sinorhizobium phage phiM9]|uniref:Uncharacterized protein n=1 Tax=Sinorhizobium phage phiM9 TaxID=1636182 RepID=A0A0F6R541_9CAUD|nr:hypothetical protein AU106_gp206 [Sinorhizobium phage phiM9]AKE44837.1 hypothetical protein Sm_phiM9_210 [Sinorhizobium phage phiM9]
MKTRTKQAAFVIDYMTKNSFGTYNGGREFGSKSFSGCTTYDDDLDFICAFGDAFPPRKPDPNHILSSITLRRVLKQLSDDGYLDRGRLGNEKYVRQEPSWQFVYSLKQWVLKDIRTNGKTAEEIAIEWNGV